MGLEQLVRPFQLLDVSPPQTVASSTDISAAPSGATFSITASPAGKTEQVSYSHSVTNYSIKIQKEKKKSSAGPAGDGFYGTDFLNAIASDHDAFDADPAMWGFG